MHNNRHGTHVLVIFLCVYRMKHRQHAPRCVLHNVLPLESASSDIKGVQASYNPGKFDCIIDLNRSHFSMPYMSVDNHGCLLWYYIDISAVIQTYTVNLASWYCFMLHLRFFMDRAFFSQRIHIDHAFLVSHQSPQYGKKTSHMYFGVYWGRKVGQLIV